MTGGEDYVIGPYSIVFTAGIKQAKFNVAINNDRIFETDETFTLTINSSSLPSDVIVNDQDKATVTIVDDDGKLY